MSTSEANLRQHGGAHYMMKEYQHWDFATDLRLPYLIGCASKYVSRWKDKGGVLDLQKAGHYMDKAIERGVVVPELTREGEDKLSSFSHQFGAEECIIIQQMARGKFYAARDGIQALLESASDNSPPV